MIAKTAGEAVDRQGYASAIDVLLGIGWLTKADLEAWRRGNVPYLEQAVGANLSKIGGAMNEFRTWSARAKLKASVTHYHSFGRGSKRAPRFSKSGAPGIETAYSTHFVLVRKVSPETQAATTTDVIKVGGP